MRKIKININTQITPAEKFFIEKSVELLSEETIDTYRLRLHNPKTILNELKYLIKSFFDHNISEDYAKACIEEAKDLLNHDKELRFSTIDRNYILALFGDKNLNRIFYAINILLSENRDYLEQLFEAIETEINKLNGHEKVYPLHFKRLNYLIAFLYVELRTKGFNKKYLHRTIRAIFSGNSPSDNFIAKFNIVKAISKRPLELFTVYFVIETENHNLRYVNNNPIKLTHNKKSHLIRYSTSLGNEAFKEFISVGDNSHIYSTEITTTDYYSASIEGRKIIQQCLDFCFLGGEKDEIIVNQNCFVMGSIDPSKSKAQNLNYILDGDIRGSYRTFKIFTEKFSTLSTNNIQDAAIDKIRSGLRYLRLGNQKTLSPEQKLINYWIAIEYMFSSYDGSANKITRLKEFFKKIHAYSYTRKLFKDLHHSIKNMGLDNRISQYNVDDLTYLTLESTENELFAVINEYPLLNYRIASLNERFKEAKALGTELKRHMNNLERNIMRMYRVRNQIVHNAISDVSKDDIFELTAHLKYYVTFVINGLLDFLLEYPIDTNDDKSIGIDDYFNIMALKIDGLISNKTTTNVKLITLNSPIEYLRK